MNTTELAPEILRQEIIDWWENERQKISNSLPERRQALFYKVDKIIDGMPIKKLLSRKQFVEEKILPEINSGIEKMYRELTLEVDESFRASSQNVEGGGHYGNWSYSEMVTAGAAIAVSAAPVAGIPFFAGGLTTAGTWVVVTTLGGGALIPTAVAAAAGSAILLAAGPTVRSKAVAKLTSNLKKAIHKEIDYMVLELSNDNTKPSLKQRLFNELQGIAVKRMEMAK